MSEEKTDPETKPEDDEIKLSKSEHDRLKRAAAEGDKKVRRLEAEVEDMKAKLDEAAAGDDEAAKLTKRAERAEARAEAAEGKVKELEGQIETSSRESKAISIAQRLNFRNPARAIRLLDSEALEDEASTERALEALAREDSYLVSERKQRDVTEPDRGKASPGKDEPNGDQPTGQARIRDHYEKQAEAAGATT